MIYRADGSVYERQNNKCPWQAITAVFVLGLIALFVAYHQMIKLTSASATACALATKAIDDRDREIDRLRGCER